MGNCLVGLKGALGNYKLEENFYENFLNGDIDELVDSLTAADRAERLKGEEFKIF